MTNEAWKTFIWFITSMICWILGIIFGVMI